MKVSELFTKTLRQAPNDADDQTTAFLIQAGYISKVQAGGYAMMPLGFTVLEKIKAIVRKHLNAIGAQEVAMTALLPREMWEKTGRWESAKDVMYRLKSSENTAESDLVLGFTHEEPITVAARQFIHSYRDLPKAIYQMQIKFRNEPRAKSGLLRGREFWMKDLYSFHTSEADLDTYYDKVIEAYHKIFKELGLDAILTEASGGLFSKYSHEFQVISELGEDIIYYTDDRSFAQNEEVFESEKAPKGTKEAKSIEVGNIFKLGTRYSEPLGLKFTSPGGATQPVIMASYGIGLSRAMGTIAALNRDDSGLVWPSNLAPFQLYFAELGRQEGIPELSKKVMFELDKNKIKYLYDDRDEAPGSKLADADLLGIPWRLIVSKKTVLTGQVELKNRTEKEGRLIKISEIKEAIDG